MKWLVCGKSQEQTYAGPDGFRRQSRRPKRWSNYDMCPVGGDKNALFQSQLHTMHHCRLYIDDTAALRLDFHAQQPLWCPVMTWWIVTLCLSASWRKSLQQAALDRILMSTCHQGSPIVPFLSCPSSYAHYSAMLCIAFDQFQRRLIIFSFYPWSVARWDLMFAWLCS